jgi:hypothetical protein
MGKIFDGVDERLERWMAAQPMFFVGTAPLDSDGHVNVSPKGPIDSLRVLGPSRVAYLDMVGSGAETVAHLRENGRIVIMLCAFEGPPRIVRLHGHGSVVVAGDPRFDELLGPLMSYQSRRPHMDLWAAKKLRVGGPDALVEYQREKNLVSIDGLPAVDLPVPVVE